MSVVLFPVEAVAAHLLHSGGLLGSLPGVYAFKILPFTRLQHSTISFKLHPYLSSLSLRPSSPQNVLHVGWLHSGCSCSRTSGLPSPPLPLVLVRSARLCGWRLWGDLGRVMRRRHFDLPVMKNFTAGKVSVYYGGHVPVSLWKHLITSIVRKVMQKVHWLELYSYFGLEIPASPV